MEENVGEGCSDERCLLARPDSMKLGGLPSFGSERILMFNLFLNNDYEVRV
ncbi:hypothetical protein PSE_3832 [Pseudovibrio sp. FO-BEG1]|nr:hypothetical protein PSE_3832 [Pseudovibrio sp. FO-BEG1]